VLEEEVTLYTYVCRQCNDALTHAVSGAMWHMLAMCFLAECIFKADSIDVRNHDHPCCGVWALMSLLKCV
jgi:hypothetical protein